MFCIYMYVLYIYICVLLSRVPEDGFLCENYCLGTYPESLPCGGCSYCQKLLLLNGLFKSAQTFTVGFVKLLSTHPIHIVWGNFPFNLF